MKDRKKSESSNQAGFIHYDDAQSTFHGAASFSIANRITRIVWRLAWALLASWTPPPMHRWRIFLANCFGANIDSSCSLYSSVKIWLPANLEMKYASTLGPGVDCYCMARIEIGEYAVVSQRAFLCTGTHRIHNPSFQIYAKEIRIEKNSWIAADAFVGPGVTVKEGAVLSARAAAFTDLDCWAVYLGNPAVKIKARTYFERLHL